MKQRTTDISNQCSWTCAGCCNVVFVGESQTRFRPRKLRLGCESGDFYEVLEGLKGDESVVTQGSFLLKTEILKNQVKPVTVPQP